MHLPDYTPVEDDYPPGNPNLPFGYLGGLVGWLAANRDWKVLNYADLGIKPGQTRENYHTEFKKWHVLHIPSRHKYMLIQYDVDARPDVTEALVRVHLAAGIPANIMLFNKRIWDRVFKKENRIEYDESYKPDYGLLREFQSAGGIVGYHCNVWERALFDYSKAEELFKRDVEDLRKELDITYFSMHGGPLDKNGKSNAHMGIEETAAELGLIWVHNGKSPSFHRNWDDGGAGHANFKYRIGDVSETIAILNNGQRLRCLFHPQYYRCISAKHVKNINQAGYSWFEDMLEKFEQKERRADKKPFWNIFRKRSDEGDIWSDTDWFARQYWPERYHQQIDIAQEYKSAINEAKSDAPVFVNGMSRSGTTLLAGLFDVHHDIAMSYELYPNYLIGQGEQMERYIDYTEIAYILRNTTEDEAYRLVREKGEEDVIRYMACANHSDLTPNDVGNLLFWYLKTNSTLYTYSDALMFISACAKLKMLRTGKNLWGMKIQGKFEKYHKLWPRARFIYILRDGRDVLASQLKNGSFNPDPEQVGKNWAYRIKRFNEFIQNSGAVGIILKYEDLVCEPKKTIMDMCDKLELSFSDNMLKHTKHDISLLHNPRGQLSADRLAQPIDTSSIGRWKAELTHEQIKNLEREAGGLLNEYGY